MLKARNSTPQQHAFASASDSLDPLSPEKMDIVTTFVSKIRHNLETGIWRAKDTISTHELDSFIDEELALAVDFVQQQRFNMLVRQPVSMKGAQDHIDITRVLYLSHRNVFEVQYSA